MEKVGEYLKSVREEKNITLEEVSEKTKIKVRFLVDIENDIFDNLGGAGYAKAMILTYARLIGADQKKILENLNLSETHSGIDKTKSIQPKKLLIPTTIFSLFLLIILVIILIFVAVKYYPEWRSKSQFQKKITTKIETKKTVKKTNAVSPSKELNLKKEKKEKKKKNKESKVVINEEALKDTTDYLDKLLFKEEKSPFNYKE